MPGGDFGRLFVTSLCLVNSYVAVFREGLSCQIVTPASCDVTAGLPYSTKLRPGTSWEHRVRPPGGSLGEAREGGHSTGRILQFEVV